MSDAKALATTKGQIHEDNIELSVYSCWTAKLLLRAKLVSSHIDPKGKFITFDIDDDETAKPQFLESQPQSRLLIEERPKDGASICNASDAASKLSSSTW